MGMKRKIYRQLLDWKQRDDGTTAVLIEGARRIGKSYIAEAFAKNEYDSYILIDFSLAPDEIKEIFDHYLHDLDELFGRLELFYNVSLHRMRSVLILDEL